MKKDYILYWIIVFLVLCISFLLFDKFNNGNDDKYFNNNLECQTHLKEFKDKFSSYKNHSVFYSPIENSCLWIFRNDFWFSTIWEIINIFDNENDNSKYSFYSRYESEEMEGASIHSLFKNIECSDISQEGNNKCNIKDYQELMKLMDDEINYLKWN